jgi:ABC-type bacteriocin/lantibiotic exporter with double-glycine peptidase domain
MVVVDISTALWPLAAVMVIAVPVFALIRYFTWRKESKQSNPNKESRGE